MARYVTRNLGCGRALALDREALRTCDDRLVKESWPPVLRRTVEAAEAQCRDLRHGYLGTEHLLLGLLACEDTSAARRVVQAGGSLEDVRSLVVRIVGQGAEGTEYRWRPYTTNAAAVCVRVADEAERFGPGAIGTEHVLRAVLRRRSIAFHVLADLGVDPEALANGVPRLRRGG